MEGLLKNLQLPKAERKSVRIGGGLRGGHGDAPPQAFGKLLPKWGVRSETLVQAIGWN